MIQSNLFLRSYSLILKYANNCIPSFALVSQHGFNWMPLDKSSSEQSDIKCSMVLLELPTLTNAKANGFSRG